MEASTRIKILKAPEVTDLAGEKVMIDFDSGKYFMLVGSANDIWDALKDGISVEEIVTHLLELYDVEESVCREKTILFLEKLVEVGFIAAL